MMLSSPSPSRLDDLPAPAKINLFLHIVGRRADGYHLLQSMFVLLDIGDLLSFERRSDGKVHREDRQPGDLPADDLCVRAARALQQATGCSQGVHIVLDKRLPAQAGLGGGSSNAATCLLALNRLWGLGLRRHELATIGLQLGADVPFFLGGHTAWVEGVGDRLTPARLPPTRYLLVKPPEGSPTAGVYADPTLKRDTRPLKIEDFAAEALHSDSDALCLDERRLMAGTRNGMQPVVQRLCPSVTEGLERLKQHGFDGRMTGSGTALFARMDERDPPDALAWPPGWWSCCCSTMDSHPLRDWCSD